MGNQRSKGMEVPATVPPPEPFLDYSKIQGPHWTWDGRAQKEIHLAASGSAASESLTLTQIFRRCVAKHKNSPALKTEDPCPQYVQGQDSISVPLDKWKTWTYQQYHDDAVKFSKAALATGVLKFDSVVVHGFNCPQFAISLMGATMAGTKLTGLYATDSTEQVIFKTQHSDASLVALQDEKALAHFEHGIEQLPYLKAIVMWGEKPRTKELTRKDATVVVVYSWEEFLNSGGNVSDAEFEQRANDQHPGECAALIYTSGTTGNPKAVMIAHDSMAYLGAALQASVPEIRRLVGMNTVLSYLPLSHIAGLVMDIIGPLYSSMNNEGHFTVCFARKYDLSTGALRFRLQAVNPYLFLGVPRVWEKISESLRAKAPTGAKAQLSKWAKGRALAYAKNCQLGGSGIKPPRTDLALNKILIKVKEALGLTKMAYGLSGAAPISRETIEYFASIGITVNDVYGMSESCGATTISNNVCKLWGTVGFPIPGAEVKIFHVNPADINDKQECPPCENFEHPEEAAQGEICFRGRHIMLGYLANPKLGEEHVAEIAKKNAEAIDAQGWLHSGDMGCIYKGMLRVTGRYKELIIGAGGENVAPVPIEDGLKKLCPAISNVMMIGDKRKFNIAFITLKAFGATGETPGTNQLIGEAKFVNPSVKTISDAVKDEEYIATIAKAIEQNNKNAPNNASTIQRFTILPRDFSVATGEFTPTLKLKRDFTQKMYMQMIDKVYEPTDMTTTYVPWMLEIGGVEEAAPGEASKFQAHAGIDIHIDEQQAKLAISELHSDGERMSAMVPQKGEE